MPRPARTHLAATTIAVAVLLAAGCSGGDGDAPASQSAGPAHQVQITVTGGPGTTYQVIKDGVAAAPATVPESRQDVVAFTAAGQVSKLEVKVTGHLPDTFGCDITVDGRNVAQKHRDTNPQNALTVVATCDSTA